MLSAEEAPRGSVSRLHPRGLLGNGSATSTCFPAAQTGSRVFSLCVLTPRFRERFSLTWLGTCSGLPWGEFIIKFLCLLRTSTALY